MRTNGLEIADIFREYGHAFRETYPVPAYYTKVMNLIVCCRSAAMGSHTERCDECGYERVAYNSCRNRHCPKCQYTAREKWIIERESELLPVPYYHIVFTIPDLLNKIVLVNKQIMYDILFGAASETLLVLGKDEKHLGAEIGLIAVLHTWGQNLMDHPHLHCIVPGGGLIRNKARWVLPKKAKYNEFFIHVNIISDLFKKKFLYYFKKVYKSEELKFAGSIKYLSAPEMFHDLLNVLYKKKWVSYCKRPFGGPEQVLEYLGRYTHRVALTNSRIKRIEDGHVIFEWKDYRKGNEKKEMALSPVEFIRRFMLHILPEGFFKIRYYGILSSRNKKKALAQCREILAKEDASINQTANKVRTELIQTEVTIRDIKKCPQCKAGMMGCINVAIRAA